MGKQLMEKVHDYSWEMHCKIATIATMNFQEQEHSMKNWGMSAILYTQGMLVKQHVYF
ncbi:hypothetical protein [Wolbachia endosymbiont of Mansonella perstans]|uniref:hypothetical protein n=1 Tax=Wolbachia endosymbiont of Mansonella perstans TaxID=229526 RepID=UPI0034CE603F